MANKVLHFFKKIFDARIFDVENFSIVVILKKEISLLFREPGPLNISVYLPNSRGHR